MAMALEILTPLPFGVSYIICSLLIIPLVTHGITLIGWFQLWTQPLDGTANSCLYSDYLSGDAIR